jgi:phage protein D
MSSPRGLVEVDGQLLRWPDVTEIKVNGTLYMAADTFEVTVRNDQYLSDWFRKGQEVRIYLGYVNDANQWFKSELQHVFTGKLDGITAPFGSTMTCKLIGRDYAAPFLDTTFTVAYAERTGSQIAGIIAGKYGLTLRITATTEIIDRDMYQNKKEWEVLQSLADLEGFVCFVDKDKNFYFGPRDLSDDQIEAQLYYRQGLKSNCTIEFDDNALDAFNQVTVRHYQDKQLIEGIAKDDALIASMGQVKERVYMTSKAKTSELATQIAQKLLPEFSRYVITGRATKLAGIPTLACEKKVSVSGCGRFDGNYYVERFDHTLNKQGFITTMDLTSLRPDEAAQYRSDLYNKDKSVLGSTHMLGKATL